MDEIGKSEKLTQHVIRQINNIFGLEKKEINILIIEITEFLQEETRKRTSEIIIDH